MMHDIMAPDRALPWLALAFAVGYLLGSIPFGVLVARLRGLGDLRSIGSGNIGATNVLRTGDRKAAAATLVLDGAKGAAAVLLMAAWGPAASLLAGLGAFLGHLFPVWLRFRGGKGVATFIGITLALYFPGGLLVCAAWLAAAKLSRISSVGALACSALAPAIFAALSRWESVLLLLVLSAMLWLAHAKNIRRLLRGEEPRIGGAKGRAG
jgi:glycerol-3-phosphate acyltransferase PlsY